ncbi:MAG: hypothetical protein R3Y11_05275 [Pseudomonadota bacterium]
MAREQKVSLIEAEPLVLFDYENNGHSTRITISAYRTNLRKRDTGRELRGHTVQNHVDFTFCGVQLTQSYKALNGILALVMAYEKRQFSAGTSSLSMQVPHEKYSNLYAFSRLGKTPQGHTIMEIGLTRKLEAGMVRLSQSMHIGYAYAFHNALLKAMNWIAPVQGVEHVERY